MLAEDGEMDPPSYIRARLKSEQKHIVNEEPQGISMKKSQEELLAENVPEEMVQEYEQKIAQVYQSVSDQEIGGQLPGAA
jgi:hypothetical protein